MKTRLAILGVVACFGAFALVVTRISASHRQVEAFALMATLSQCYDFALSTTNPPNEREAGFNPISARKILVRKLSATPSLLPSFGGGTNLYIASRSATVGSTNLIMAIKVSDGFIWGISADRQVRELNLAEFDNWEHEQL